MRLIRFSANGATGWGILHGKAVHRVLQSVYDGTAVGEYVGTMADIELLPPCEPTKVLAVAYNYKDLVGARAHYDEPLLFLKSPTGVIGPRDPIAIPPQVERVWVEVELAFVVRRRARNVPVTHASECILGYTIANDVTAANVYGRDHHLARSKALDSFCPIGPYLETEIQTDNLTLTTAINGRVTQHGTTANRILSDVETVSLLSHFVTLEPGDLVLTGTPAGAMDSVIRPGDSAILCIEGLGELANPIIGLSAADGRRE